MQRQSVRQWRGRLVGLAAVTAFWVGAGTSLAAAEPDDETITHIKTAEVATVLADALGSIGRSDALRELGAPISEVAGCVVGSAPAGPGVPAVVTSCASPIAAIDPSIVLRIVSAIDFERLLDVLAGNGRSSRYIMPASGTISSPFGDGRNHEGIDIAAPMNSPIRAVADGEVIDSGPASGFGLWVRVRHDDGYITTYGHNNTNLVRVGDRVRAGQKIATVGNRGESTGPHLHFEVESPSGQVVDPEEWLAG